MIPSVDFQAIQEATYNAEADEQAREDAEESYAMAEDLINVSIHSDDDYDDDYCMSLNSTVISNDPSLEQSMNLSEVVRVAKGVNEAGVQTVPVVPDRPQIRVKAKVCIEQIKATLCKCILCVWNFC